MDVGLKALSNITVFSKYAKYIPELKRRETWDEIVDRYETMMIKKYPKLEKNIHDNALFIRNKKVLPSMRALQFAGAAMEVNNARGYNCFSRDTRFITSKGVKSFEDFNYGDTVSVLTHKGNWKNAVVKSYGRQQLTEIQFAKGKSSKKVKSTANHRWILKSGEETTSLKNGDIIYGAPDFISSFNWEDASVIEKIAWCYGYVYGDGTRLKKNGEYKRSLVRLCGDQVKYLERFEEIGFESSSSMSLKGDVIVYTGKYLKTLPEIETCSFEELRAFVIGYLDADGAKVYGRKNKQLYRGIQSSNTESIKFIKDAFEVVSMYILNETDLTNQQTNYGIRPETSWFSMNHVIGTGPNNHWSVKNITVLQEEEVWCLEVEDDHSFVLSGGIVTGNCCYHPINSIYSFSETMYLLLGGTGVGYSVQKHHVEQLPAIMKKGKKRHYLIEDSIMGWADAVKVLLKAYLEGKFTPDFDFRAIRHKGARLITAGGKAPGPEPLKICLTHIQAILDRKQEGEQLSPLECHDILCHIANSVLAGGIRRSAMIAFFSHDDEEMITCKYGNWWELNEQRGRSNNSAVLKRGEVSKEEFDSLWKRIELSNSGEPGIYWTNNLEWGSNPCVTGDTEILTKEGYKEIQSLVDNEVEIWNGFEWSKVTPQITGYNQHMLKVTLSDGRKLTSTDYHNWILAEGYTEKNKKVKSKDLKIGDKIIKYNFPIIKEGEQVSFKHAYTQGFISAEGMDDYNYFWLYEPKYMCKDRLDIKSEGSEYSNINRIKRKSIHYNDIYNEKSYVPFEWCLTSKIEWLSGLFDGDGTELIEGGLQLCSTDFNFLKDLQKLLSTLGINSKVIHAQEEGNRLMPDGKGGEKEYFCQKSWRICIGAVQMQELKTLGLQCERMSFDKTPQRDASQFVKIVKIEDAGYADVVYCFNEPNRNYGVFNGILTGQCVEIGLRPYQFCNLCELNVNDITSQEDLNERASVASFFGTLQAGFTDFHYLRPIWKDTTQKDALLGIGMTGIASGEVLKYNLEVAAHFAKLTNQLVSDIISINEAARLTCIKPSGTTSLVLGTSSGIHAWHNDYYLRTMRFNKNEDLAAYLMVNHPEICEDDQLRPHDTLCVRIPVKAPEGSIFRTETAIDTLERVKKFSKEWIKEGHINGDNSHNVSATISIDKDRKYYYTDAEYNAAGEMQWEFRDLPELYGKTPTTSQEIDYGGVFDEWDAVGEWMWENQEFYNGLSVLPYFGGSFVQAPFEDVSEEEYVKRIESVKEIDLTKVIELDDTVDFSSIAACAGGQCSID